MGFLGVISFAAGALRLSGIQLLAKGLGVALRTLLVVGARLVQILGWKVRKDGKISIGRSSPTH